jgi:tetratricopeptide (TPR) repeat protein
MKFMPAWVAVVAVTCLAGCGSRQMPADQLRSAESSYSAAMEALQGKDYATALEHFNAAIEEAGLNADLLGEALLRSAECHIELGNLDEAAAVLESLADRAPEMDQYHLVCCKLYAKQGNAAKARAAYEAAREINPEIQPPVALN